MVIPNLLLRYQASLTWLGRVVDDQYFLLLITLINAVSICGA